MQLSNVVVNFFRSLLRRTQKRQRTAAFAFTFCRLVALMLILLPSRLVAQAPLSETAAFDAAARAQQLGDYKRARKEFSQFITNFPQSAQIPEAVLFQASAALKLGDPKDAISLLSSNLGRAGLLTEQYRYSLGQAHLQANNYVVAADTFARFVQDFPNSSDIIGAAYGEAVARFQLKEWPRVIDLLQSENQPFQKSMRLRPNDKLIVPGLLLLGEALMEQKHWPQAEAVLARLSPDTPELQWQRQNLVCRSQVAQSKWHEALAASSNLFALAQGAASPALRAESVVVQAGILQELKRPSEAAAVYEQNLRKDVPPERRRQAFLKIIDLTLSQLTGAPTLAQQAIDQAAQRLERLLGDHSTEAGSDVARLTLGELRLKQHFSQANGTGTNSPPPLTNSLSLALSQFEELLANAPQSSVAGKAQLDRGWCLWEAGRIGDSAAAFKAAADQLPHSEDQAVARFKFGDALLVRKDYSNALENFRTILGGYNDLPSVRARLLPHALYHSLRCNIELNNLAEASDAMRQMLRFYAETPFAEKSVLLLGQQLSSAGQPDAARRLFADFSQRFSASALLPQVELATARSYAQEKKWDAAIRELDQWVARYPTNDLRSQAEFSRGWAYFQAGQDTNALVVFTNFLAQFPSNDLAASALRWVGDFYYRQGDFENAERHYQLIFRFPASEFTYEARMLAGKAAFARESYKNAAGYFRSIINDNSPPPPDLVAEAYFALGDTMLKQDPEGGKTPFQKFADARVAFEKIPLLYPTNRLVLRAWGAIANCYFQMASNDPKFYDNAREEYQKVISLAESDVSVRSQAEVGLGAVFEAQGHLADAADPEALFDKAADHYMNVLTGKTSGDQTADIFWIKKAGLEAARLAEERKQWTVAINIYKTLSTAIPSARAAFQRRIDRLQEQSRTDAK